MKKKIINLQKKKKIKKKKKKYIFDKYINKKLGVNMKLYKVKQYFLYSNNLINIL